jgi:hypothetical protein
MDRTFDGREAPEGSGWTYSSRVRTTAESGPPPDPSAPRLDVLRPDLGSTVHTFDCNESNISVVEPRNIRRDVLLAGFATVLLTVEGPIRPISASDDSRRPTPSIPVTHTYAGAGQQEDRAPRRSRRSSRSHLIRSSTRKRRRRSAWSSSSRRIDFLCRAVRDRGGNRSLLVEGSRRLLRRNSDVVSGEDLTRSGAQTKLSFPSE